MRPEVSAFVADGPLPDEETGEEEEIDRRARQLEAMARPLSLAEAQALAGCFGPDDGPSDRDRPGPGAHARTGVRSGRARADPRVGGRRRTGRGGGRARRSRGRGHRGFSGVIGSLPCLMS